jgi:phosphate acyltransferase
MDLIAVDAMGGDFAPEATVRGALECIADPRCDFSIVLFGDEQKIAPILAASTKTSRITIRHTSEVIEMHDSATSALKSKKDSSIVRALEAHRDGEVQGFISAGNTGAVMAASTLILGRVQGIARPTIGAFLPTQKGRTLVVDAGANVDSKAHHLVQFGIMGSIFTKLIFGTEHPTVGLLNVGEEQGKGYDVITEAENLLRQTPINFIGNIEGGDILKGTVDVAVCDGFIGNIILKFAESVPALLKNKFRTFADQGPLKKIWIGMFANTMRGLLKDWDYQEYGGVPLLGVRGTSIIGHGKSSPRAINNMIFRAKEMIDRNVFQQIGESIRTLPQIR